MQRHGACRYFRPRSRGEALSAAPRIHRASRADPRSYRAARSSPPAEATEVTRTALAFGFDVSTSLVRNGDGSLAPLDALTRKDDIRREFHTPKPCASKCPIAYAHQASRLDTFRAQDPARRAGSPL